ncbi:phenylalanine--tRNA ligase subunit beta [Candidatus Dojkabacteria bacterium]|nr:phenylalanine--tRNA ligase subunit beta [Candidatus Dojkabacteria bacterium]
MFISYNWLKKYIPGIIDHSPEEIAKKVSLSLAEVEKIERKGEGLNKIVVGEITEVRNHPTNAKFAIATVKISDSQKITVVFAGSNQDYVKEGVLYPVCIDGGSVYDSNNNIKRIVKTELEGVISEGMLCSLAELGLENEKKGLTLIEDNLPVGTDLIPLLQDYIFEIENKSITHRPDCFSHKGIAREISAMFDLEFKENNENDITTNEKEKIKINILANDVCSRFSCISMRDIKVKSSPTWLKIFLYNLGQKPINNIVDVSNYIMLDMGQPMHIYDLDKLNTKQVYVRRAKKGEKIETINHKSYQLKINHLVISTEKNIEGIAGIMGSHRSEIDANTNNILIEAANFDMFSIRRTGMELGLQSDASIRFSKGLTNTITKDAVIAAVKILEDISHAEVSSKFTDEYVGIDEIKTIEFNLNIIKRLGGVTIEKSKIISILNSLNIGVEGAENIPSEISKIPNANVILTIPPYRKDLNIPQDIVEEVVRIYGYENINPDVPSKSISPTPQNKDYEFTYLCKRQLVAVGFDEIYNYSFVGSSTYKKSNLSTEALLKVINAIAPELEFFRDNLLPSLIEKVELNSSTFDNFGFFELSRILKRTLEEEVPIHQKKIAVLQYSKKGDSNEDLKSKISKFLYSINLQNFSFRNLYNFDKSKISKEDKELLSLFHPNQTLLITYSNQILGYLGLLNPIINNNFGFDANISIAYLDYQTIFDIFSSLKPDFKSINYFPSVYRDTNFKVSQNEVDYGEIIDELSNIRNEQLSKWEVKFLDLYTDQATNEKYLTLRFIMQKEKGTLSEKEIEEMVKKVTLLMEEKYNIQERYI